MDLELRPVTPEEFPTFVRTCEATFGVHVNDDAVERARRLLPCDRTLAGFDGDELVATGGAFDSEVTLPGGARLPVGAVTFVGVLATHRRRGILRSLMAQQLDDLAERGIAAAVLTASESGIYGRFGYGEASTSVDWSIRTEGARFAREPDVAGRMRLVTPDQVRAHAPGVYERAVAGIPGTMPRTGAWWDIFVSDPEEWRDGEAELFHAVHESPTGEVDGYTSWRIKDGWTAADLPDLELHVVDLYGTTPDVEAAIFRFLLDVDLVRTVRADRRPVDDHLRWRLADRRRFVIDKVLDGLYVRVLDPAAVFSARRYGTANTFVLEVIDPFRPTTEGRWLVEGGPDGATCRRSDREADLTLDVADVGSLTLGGVPVSRLHRAGRIEEHTTGAVTAADAFFGSGVAPWLTTGF